MAALGSDGDQVVAGGFGGAGDVAGGLGLVDEEVDLVSARAGEVGATGRAAHTPASEYERSDNFRWLMLIATTGSGGVDLLDRPIMRCVGSQIGREG